MWDWLTNKTKQNSPDPELDADDKMERAAYARNHPDYENQDEHQWDRKPIVREVKR